MVWSFKRRFHHDGNFDEYETRLCVHGDKEQHGDTSETHLHQKYCGYMLVHYWYSRRYTIYTQNQ